MSARASIFTPTSITRRDVEVTVVTGEPDDDGSPYALLLRPGESPADADGDRLAALGFTGKPGQVMVWPGSPARVLVGTGESLDATGLRDAAGAFSRAVPGAPRLVLPLPAGLDAAEAATAAVEGALLARYSYRLGAADPVAPLDALVLVAPEGAADAARAGAARGAATAGATALSRDLANAPGGALTARRFAEIATELGEAAGLAVEVFDEDALRELGCGGLLGVNLGSVEPPRMVKLTYTPDGEPTGRLSLVGKGIMYDSGGIALKPGDLMHAAMKNDMTGAGAILAAMTVLRDLGCTTSVVAHLMCTDNMPSGTAMKLGDVLTTRGGKTVEVLNTDAEGRLVMADALVLSTEEPTDAIVDIATLTGACMRALGTRVAGVIGTAADLVDQVRAAGTRTDEQVWELPLERRYRKELDSPIADIANIGGPNAGAITAALFLAEFVGDVPWAHIDIAGTAQSDRVDGWINKGATGFGARLLVDLAMNFTAPGR